MKNNEVILTVCLPTYNRSGYIKNQLQFFEKEVKSANSILNDVRFVVMDNASIDDTRQVLTEFHNKSDFFEFQTNTENLGLVGNIVKLFNLSNSEYIWFVSDDDDLKEGVVEEILNIIKNNKNPEYIFLNYLTSNKKGYNGLGGYREDSKEAAMQVFREGYGSLVFMTSCIYKRENLIQISEYPMFKELSAPLFYSFYCCSKGPIFITENIWVYFRKGNASYRGFIRILKLKFEEYISILEFLPNFGYSNLEVKKTIQIFFESQSHSHLLYNGINFFNSLRLYKYYSFKTAIKFPKNIVSYLNK